ncbi:hypothetical protein [Pedobacter sp. JCM 36344]|uniref:hypothetical protein n=1 Tax=Pedobacter sp. JCM 36344 TaxID=3374280 RepID=UPI00397DA229
MKTDTAKVRLLNELSYEVVEADTALAHKYANEALVKARSVGYSEGMVSAYYNIAYVYELLYKQRVAESYYLKGIAIANQKALPRSAAFGYQNYAVLLKKERKFKQALQTNLQAVHLYDRLRDTLHLAVVYTNVGNCYSNLNLPELAITYCNNALSRVNRIFEYQFEST